ncbi:MAG: hypothetical protein M1823_000760 [Watsoniomyces obsoletus]|nr:MAG: hypothetical protein M1823_000760 [Watsoniomyces obsoletus]
MADAPSVLPAATNTAAEPLFANVHFSFIPGNGLHADQIKDLTARIERNGAILVPLLDDAGRVDLERVTHIIAATSDFPDYGPATDAMISVVQPEWITTSLARKKLAQIRPYNPDPRLFFAGVTICCAGLPSGDKDAIIGGVVAMGGQYTGSLSRVVTHIVALTEQNEKCQQAMARKMPCSMVLPHWFDDCLRLGRRIDERPYRLPDPEITRVSSTDPVPLPSDAHLKGASSPQAGLPPTPSKKKSEVRSDLNVFRGKKVMLSHDLDLGSRLRGTIEDLIAGGGGAVTGSIHKADIYVCQYREGHEYRVASRGGKDVGNLPWLYYLITHNTWTSPLRRLLHYPVARGGLAEFRKYKISLSNYGGEARLYLENLVTAIGAEYTKTLRQDNTHLLTARPYSEKCDAARDWNIHMVNHLWLEESYARWEEQSLTTSRYTHFPARTNLGEVVGQTQIDRQAMETIFYPPDEETTTTTSTDDEKMPLPLPLPMAMKPVVPTESTPMRSGGGGGASKTELKLQPTSSNAKASPSNMPIRAPQFEKVKGDINKGPKTPSRLSSEAAVVTEGRTPSTTGSRGAKDRAMAKLHDLAPDIALYEKERRRVGGVVHGGRRRSSIDPAAGTAMTTSKAGSKRSLSRDEGDDDDNNDSEHDLLNGSVRDSKQVKKARLSAPAAAPSMKFLISGYQRWVGRSKVEEDDKRRLRNLSIIIVSEPSQCTHLAAPSMIRTQKFITALAFAPIVVSTEYITQCVEKNSLPPSTNEYLLRDEASEKRLGINLQDSLARAKRNKGTLLKGHVVYCTPGVLGGMETYKAIVEANGGQCLLLKPRNSGGLVMPTAKMKMKGKAGANGHGDGDGDEGETLGDDDEGGGEGKRYIYLLSGETTEEKKLWGKFRQMVDHQMENSDDGLGKVYPRIVRTEWLLDVAMSQLMNSGEGYELDGGSGGGGTGGGRGRR